MEVDKHRQVVKQRVGVLGIGPKTSIWFSMWMYIFKNAKPGNLEIRSQAKAFVCSTAST